MIGAAIEPIQSDGTESDNTDAVLVQRALDHPTAFADLYLRYRVRVYWYVRARSRSEDDAADTTQRVFVHALARLHQYRPGRASFATWLFTIARNAAADAGRRHRPTVAWEELPDAAHPADAGDLAGALIHAEQIAHLRHLVSTLPADKQDLLALRYGAGLGVAEIAAVIGKSRHATYKQLSRLLQSLEEAYDESPDAP